MDVLRSCEDVTRQAGIKNVDAVFLPLFSQLSIEF